MESGLLSKEGIGQGVGEAEVHKKVFCVVVGEADCLNEEEAVRVCEAS